MSEKPLAGAGKPRMPWYPLYERDFTADTATWPMDAVAALIRLMNYQWHNGSIPYDQRHAARIAGCHDAEQWKEIWKTYLEDKFEQLNATSLINRRLYREYVRIEKKGAQAKRAAEKRWQKQTDNADGDADACASAMQTKNQEPRTKNKPKDKGPAVPYQSIVDLYHELCPQLPTVKVLSDKRKAQLRARWKTFEFMRGIGKPGEPKVLIKFNELETWQRYFIFITEQCPFMAGNNDRGWVANFDFVIRESGMINVMENKYVERK